MPVVKMSSGAQTQAKHCRGRGGGGPIWLSSLVYIFVSFVSAVGKK